MSLTRDGNKIVDLIGILITLIIFSIYFVICNKQYAFLKQGTERLQVLATRIAFTFPLYALIMVLSLLIPSAYSGLQIPVAFFEGYAFYCFFAFVVNNLGGPDNTVKKLIANEQNGYCCFPCCCPSDRRQFYTRGVWSEWHFVFSRTVIVIISVIFDYAGIKAVFMILQVVAFVVLANGILTLINLYESVMKECSNLKGLYKAAVIKVSTGLMVVQGLITEIVIGLNLTHLKDAFGYTAAENALRIYAFITLVEYLIISILFYFAFSAEILPSPSTGASDNPDAFKPVKLTMGEFMSKVFSITDVFGTLDLEDENQLKAPLSSFQA